MHIKVSNLHDDHTHQNNRSYLSLRNSDYAVILAATIGEENKEKIELLERTVSHLSSKLTNL